jgi:hypothetical protein
MVLHHFLAVGFVRGIVKRTDVVDGITCRASTLSGDDAALSKKSAARARAKVFFILKAMC